MSPEQVRGEELDPRTDLFSFGSTLYEMATRAQPFKGKTPAEIGQAIQTRAPAKARALNRQVSPRLEGVIAKTLEKDRTRRYQSAASLRADLARIKGTYAHRRRRWVMATVALALLAIVSAVLGLNFRGIRDRLLVAVGIRQVVPFPRIESIAVLPLKNLSGNPEQEYFADGMTDELITNLGKVRALRVISRTTAMQYKGTKKALPEIARELNVDAVVEGSVLRSGNRVRVRANLLHAPTDRHLWAQTYESEMQDVLVLQGEVALAIANNIRANLTPEDETHLTTARPIDPKAYEAFQLGRHYYYKGDYSKSIEHFQQAVQRDPNYALAYAYLGEAHGMLAAFEVPPIAEHEQKMIEAGEKAMKLDPTLPEAHVRSGDKLFYADWDWVRGEEEFRRAVELGPTSIEAVYHYALCLKVLCRFDQALQVAERARQLDPVSFQTCFLLAGLLIDARQEERAIALFQRASELELENAGYYNGLGSVYERMGKYDRAQALYLKAARIVHASPEVIQELEKASGAEGLRAYGRKRLLEALKQAKRQQPSPFAMASIYIRLGEKDQALEWLEKAYQQHQPMLAWVKARSEWDPLRSDPRFQDLLRRMNFPP